MSNCIIDQSLFRHVLIKDLKNYLKRDDYLSGFSPVELQWIRMNIDAIGTDDLEIKVRELVSGITILTYDEFRILLKKNQLIPGTIYGISDFRTIYQSSTKNRSGLYITWGDKINPSEEYLLLSIALTKDTISSNVSLYKNGLLNWIVRYNPKQEILSDGEKTRGSIIYLEDENLNKATYDFKNIRFIYNNKLYYTFSDENGNDNSMNCYSNDLCFSDNIIINGNVNNLRCSEEYVYINGIDLSNNSDKQVIKIDNKYYLDYLDIETLTHLFYGLENIFISG